MIEDRAGLGYWVERREGVSDERLLESVYDDFSRPLFRYLRAILGSDDDAEDAMGEMFVRLARDVGKLRRAEDVRSYLYRAARNAAWDQLRAKRRRNELELAAQAQLASISPSPDPEPEPDFLRRQLLALPMEQREVVALKVVEEMTFQEIAQVVGTSPNTVASRYRYGIEKLKHALTEEGQSDG